MSETSPEQQYLNLIQRIIDEGHYRPTAHQPISTQPNPPGTISIMNGNLMFDLSKGYFPLATVRWTSVKAIIAELLWFLSGSTNNEDLHALGAHIWDSWDTPETNQSIGWSPGQLGPIYGKQWRHWGARMLKPNGDLDGPGLDQIQRVCDELRDHPYSKRIGVYAYDQIDADDCFVTTCHGTFNCQIWDNELLNLHMYQRSGDVPVGVPFNIASYALLTMMLAQVSGLKPNELHITISDAHLYDFQVPSMKELVKREPLPYPKIRLNPEVTDLFAFTPGDFELVDYQYHPKLHVPVAT